MGKDKPSRQKWTNILLRPLGDAPGCKRAHLHSDISETEASCLPIQTKIVSMTIDVNLLRTDLRKVVERSMEAEAKVTGLGKEVSMLQTAVAALKTHSTCLEAHMEDTERRARRSNLRFVGLPVGVEGRAPEAFLEDWIRTTLPRAKRS
ncbi:hypothetical protein NDU88_002824 [Pleurodeles waltl]|uniref:Uncharacterized protein n=1 Tax=Pleurodeles waltl TaxID=8319 RepID=A0AAV7PF56_PLEWA|nr:hypothetical protein NDU88_002824 [Pleurodeles waltl]